MYNPGRSLTAAWETRRGRVLLTCAACLSGLGVYVGAGGTLMGVGPSRAVAAVAGAAGMPDPMRLLGLRSPGARDGDSLRSTKPPRSVREARVPRERVSTSYREHGEVPPVPDVPLTGMEVPAFPGEPSLAIGGLYPGAYAPPSGGAFLPGVPGGGVIGGGGVVGGGGVIGGGGGGIVPGTPATPDVPVVVSPVPEPATWVSMILGFAIVGSSLRRRRTGRRQDRLAA